MLAKLSYPPLIYLSSFFMALLTRCSRGKFAHICIFYFSSSICFRFILTILWLTSLITRFHSASISCFYFRTLSICCSWALNINLDSYRFSLISSNYSDKLLFTFFSSLTRILLLYISILYLPIASSSN